MQWGEDYLKQSNIFTEWLICMCVITGEISTWTGEVEAGMGAGTEGGGGGRKTISWGGGVIFVMLIDF